MNFRSSSIILTALCCALFASAALGQTTVTFDPTPSGATNYHAFNQTYGGINFGTPVSGAWCYEGAYSPDTTDNIYFCSSSATSASFQFSPAPQLLLKIDFGNMSSSAGTVTVTDDQSQTASISVPSKTMATLTTNWTKASTTITITATTLKDNVEVDNIVYQSAKSLSSNPNPLAFGNVVVGANGSLSTTITNTGSQTVNISAATLTTGTVFTLTGGPQQLALLAGGTTSYTVQFAPTAIGAASDTLSITSDAAGSPLGVSLTGTGISALSATPSPLAFGNVVQGLSSTLSTTITNVGTATVNITGAQVTGAGYSLISGAQSLALAPNATTAYSVQYAPTTTGPQTGTLAISSDAAGSPYNVSLTGTGLAPTKTLTATVNPIAFGNVPLGQSPTLSTTITNTGSVAVTISAASVTGNADFTLTNPPSGSIVLQPNGTTAFTVKFSTSSAGSQESANLTITSDATGSPWSIPVTGTCVPLTKVLSANPTSLAFSSTSLNQTGLLSTTITNTGTGTVTISSVAVTGDPSFTLSSGQQSGAIAPNGTAAYTVQYKPTVAGPVSGTLTINSDATAGAVTVSLSGAPVSASGPWLFYTDLISGPKTGGENNNGTILTIYGKRFGATQGSSTVTVGGGAVAAYLLWSDTKVSVAIGANAATGNVVVTTNAGSSNGLPFTVRSNGIIYCVSTTGLDSNTGSFPSSCFATIPHAKSVMVGGDIAYIENGVQATTVDNYNGAFSASSNKGAAGNPLAFIAYPGASVTIGTPTMSFGIKTPSISGGPFSHWVIAGIKFEGYEAIEINDANFTSVDWRIIGNELTCPNGDGSTACLETGSGASQLVFLGNYVHDVGVSTAAKTYHAVYFSSGSNTIEVGWNLIANVLGGCRGVQFYSTGTSAEYSISVHDNVIHDIRCDGINFAQVDPSQGTGVQAYNNVIYNAGRGPDPSNGMANYACIGSTDDAPASGPTPSGNIQVYNNTLYNCGARETATDAATFTKSTNGCNTGLFMNLRNNIVEQVSGEKYLYIGNSCNGTVTGSNNLWYGLGAGPSQTTGNINNVDPLFVSLTTPDFHLQSTSPAISAGITIPGLLRDLDGIARPQAPNYTLGAYEALAPAGTLSSNPPSLAFGSVMVPQTSTLTATVTNAGPGDVNISAAAVTGTGFTLVSGAQTLMLAPNATTTYTVKFAPTAWGTVAGNLAITSDATVSPFDIVLSGTGTILGDLNDDGVVDCTDVSIVKAAFGKRIGQTGYDSRADLNHDGVVDVRDLAVVTQQLPLTTVCH